MGINETGNSEEAFAIDMIGIVWKIPTKFVLIANGDDNSVIREYRLMSFVIETIHRCAAKSGFPYRGNDATDVMVECHQYKNTYNYTAKRLNL
jgi:hypothetical protein